MIKALMDKIGGLLEKEFLFGSFLPALIFAAACTVTVAGILGFEATLTWLAQRGPIDKALYPVVAAVAIIVFAYILNGIRPLVQRFWNGESLPIERSPAGNVLKSIARKDYLERYEASLQQNQWDKMAGWLQTEALAKWTTATQKACDHEVAAMLLVVSGLSCEQPRADVEKIVRQEFLAKLEVHSGESLSRVYEKLKRTFLEWQTFEEVRLGTIHWQLDRRYGAQHNIRATRLGNVMQSYSSYSLSRYGMEPEIFWPHLQTQIDKSCQEAIGNARALFDFALNLATLGLLYFFLAVFAGPWLDWSRLWFFLAPTGAAIALAGYRIAIIAAEQFGGLFRASFDLYRLNLLAALHRKASANLEQEREMWREISQLLLYGQSPNFDLTAVTPAIPAVQGAS